MWSTMAVISTTAIVVGPQFQDAAWQARFLAAFVAIPSSAFIYTSVRILAARYYFRELLGDWLYVTFPHDERERASNTSYGLMHFELSRLGRISYSVLLFNEPSALLESARHGFSSRGAHGRAWSHALSYDDSTKSLWVLYQATWHSPDRSGRIGHLYLDCSNPKRLTGNWASDIDKKKFSAGIMHACRVRDFDGVLDEYLPQRAGDYVT